MCVCLSVCLCGWVCLERGVKGVCAYNVRVCFLDIIIGSLLTKTEMSYNTIFTFVGKVHTRAQYIFINLYRPISFQKVSTFNQIACCRPVT